MAAADNGVTARPRMWPPDGRWREEAERIDAALYAAVARTSTPTLDQAMSRLSRLADYSRLWILAAAILAAVGGPAGRRAACSGLAALSAAAAVSNMAIKPLGRRRRPDRLTAHVPPTRHTPMPLSRSFPSGHATAGFAFATGVGHVLPRVAIPFRMLAAAVAYSRVHTGVHYPGDVVAGALLGAALAQITNHALGRRPTLGG
jgi:membrane-associated phospholipid phosphatase